MRGRVNRMAQPLQNLDRNAIAKTFAKCPARTPPPSRVWSPDPFFLFSDGTPIMEVKYCSGDCEVCQMCVTLSVCGVASTFACCQDPLFHPPLNFQPSHCLFAIWRAALSLSCISILLVSLLGSPRALELVQVFICWRNNNE